MYGHKSGQPLPEDAVREAMGREIGLMADHGMNDIVACSVAFYHAPLDDIVPLDSAAPTGHKTAREKQAWRLEVLSPRSLLRCLQLRLQKWLRIDVARIVHGDDFFAEGRAEALLPEEQVPNQSCESGGTWS